MCRLIISISIVLTSLLCRSQSNPDSLFVFVGKQLRVKKIRINPQKDDIGFYNYYSVKYKVLQNIYGHYERNKITFEAYDHIGKPDFLHFKTVLLFVYKKNGKFYHIRFQYFDVYETKNGKWAAPGDPYFFDDRYRTGNVRPEAIQFKKPLTFSVSKLDSTGINQVYPAPYFTIKAHKAVAIMGTYAESLFLVKKEGELKARGFF